MTGESDIDRKETTANVRSSRSFILRLRLCRTGANGYASPYNIQTSILFVPSDTEFNLRAWYIVIIAYFLNLRIKNISYVIKIMPDTENGRLVRSEDLMCSELNICPLFHHTVRCKRHRYGCGVFTWKVKSLTEHCVYVTGKASFHCPDVTSPFESGYSGDIWISAADMITGYVVWNLGRVSEIF